MLFGSAGSRAGFMSQRGTVMTLELTLPAVVTSNDVTYCTLRSHEQRFIKIDEPRSSVANMQLVKLSP